MENLYFDIKVNAALYTKDPQSSALGNKILKQGILMLASLGYEDFTFKKLGKQIGSNESSIYRYFDSKHTLLVYLVNWYWSWTEYRLVLSTHSMVDPHRKLEKALSILTEPVRVDQRFDYIDEEVLYQIIIAESSKAYHTKDVDAENEKGFYRTYKRVVQRVSDMVLMINPDFEFPHMLISTVIEGVHHQRYFSKHLPSLTDFEEGKNNIVRFYKDLVFKTIL
jgi:AcrR family transcriptional regulator